MSPRLVGRRTVMVLALGLAMHSTASPAAASDGVVRILVVGDSLGVGYAAGMEHVVAPNRRGGERRNAEVERLASVGSGVIPRHGRPDVAAMLEQRLRRPSPRIDMVVIAIGANDVGMPIGGRLYGERWTARYGERLRALIDTAAGRGIPTFWIGQPAIRHPAFGPAIDRHIRPAQEAAVAGPDTGAVYIDLLGLTTLNGRFAASRDLGDGRARPLRAADGIHFSGQGYIFVARYIVETIEGATGVRLRPGDRAS